MEIKEKPPDTFKTSTPEYYKSVKTSLKSILKQTDINSSKINDAVFMSNKIVIRTLQFLKLFLLYSYEEHHTLPHVNHILINTTMKMIAA